jgi:hypothetical protein
MPIAARDAFAVFAFTSSIAFVSAVASTACVAQGSSTVFAGGADASAAEPTPGDDGGDGAEASAGPVDFDALFGAPASTVATPDSLDGVWAGTDPQAIDTRLRITPSSLVIAIKCSGSPSALGIDVAARVTATSIKTLESKSARATSLSNGCGALEVRPGETVRCTSTSAGAAQMESQGKAGGCFFLQGTELSFFGGVLFDGTLTKLSD